jgi:hypothetical protein
MKVCQLVLQFRPWADHTLEELLAVENQLEALTDLGADVDGHDFGSGEANIFLFTSDPAAALDRCVRVVASAGLLPLLSAGCRPTDEDVYVRTWPREDSSMFEIR